MSEGMKEIEEEGREIKKKRSGGRNNIIFIKLHCGVNTFLVWRSPELRGFMIFYII